MGIPLSVSFRTSSKSTSISHNNRTISEEKKFDKYHDHIDWSKTNENIILVQKNIRTAYDEIFSEEVKKYNDKQKRSDRKIDDYFLKVKKDKSLDLQREFIVQVGDKNFLDSLSEERQNQNRELFSEMLVKYTEWFQEKYPDLKIYNATIHLDEATPHLHMNVVPVANGYKQGMKKRPSFSKFLKNNDLDFKKFRDEQMSEIESIMKEYGAERKLVGTHEYEKPSQYRETIREAEMKSEVIIQEAKEKALESKIEAREGVEKEVLTDLDKIVHQLFDYFEFDEDDKFATDFYRDEVLNGDDKLNLIVYLEKVFEDIKLFLASLIDRVTSKESNLIHSIDQVDDMLSHLKKDDIYSEMPKNIKDLRVSMSEREVKELVSNSKSSIMGIKNISMEQLQEIQQAYSKANSIIDTQKQYISYLSKSYSELKYKDRFESKFQERLSQARSQKESLIEERDSRELGQGRSR